jgi:serine protease AprX
MEGTTRRSDDQVNNFSSRGPSWFDSFAKPDLVAPGYQLVAPAAPGSTLVVEHSQLLVAGSLTTPNAYITLNGTSMAAAVASGVAALAIEANRNAFLSVRPPLTPNAIKVIMEFTRQLTSHIRATVRALVQGNGGSTPAGARAFECHRHVGLGRLTC